MWVNQEEDKRIKEEGKMPKWRASRDVDKDMWYYSVNKRTCVSE